MRKYFRVEYYEGLSLMMSRVFESRKDANQAARSVPASGTARIIEVDRNGAALRTTNPVAKRGLTTQWQRTIPH